jgi:hypothetical protein
MAAQTYCECNCEYEERLSVNIVPVFSPMKELLCDPAHNCAVNH